MARLYSVRKRDLVFLAITVASAWGYFAAGQYLSDHVASNNTVRVVGALMTAGMSAPQTAPMSGRGAVGTLFGMRAPGPDPRSIEQQEQAEQHKKQIATVEGVVYVWRRMMWGLAGWLVFAALWGAFTARLRLWQLLAAAGILLSTAGTVAGVWLLVNPAWGGMPPLSRWTYVLVPAVQGLYALVLIAAYVRRMPVALSWPESRSVFDDERADSARA